MPSSEHALATAKWFSPLGPAYLGRTWFPLPPAQLEADVRGPGRGASRLVFRAEMEGSRWRRVRKGRNPWPLFLRLIPGLFHVRPD